MYKYKQSLELNCVLEVGIVVKGIHIASQHLMAVGKLVLCMCVCARACVHVWKDNDRKYPQVLRMYMALGQSARSWDNNTTWNQTTVIRYGGCKLKYNYSAQ